MLKSKIMIPVKVFIITCIILGCQNNGILKRINIFSEQIVMASSNVNDGIPALFVQYESKGHNVFVECIVTGVTFREKNDSNQKAGKMIVWIDGKKSKEVSTAAFIIKDLAKGNHKLKLEVVDLHNKPYGLTKEFMVNIPK